MSDARDSIQDRAKNYLANIKGITEVEVIREPEEIAGDGKLVTTKLKRDGQDTWGWYFERGEVRKALFTGEEIAKFISQQVSPKSFREILSVTPPLELIKVIIVSSLTLLFAVSVVYVVIKDPGNQSLQILSGLLGLTIGWFVGKADKAS